MKTKIGHYYIFFSEVEFWKKVNYWKSKGRTWIQESHENYNPKVKQEDMPCVLNVDDYYMIQGKVHSNEKLYFSDPTFVKLYNKTLRELKIKRILK